VFAVFFSKSNPIIGLDKPRRFQQVEDPRFQDIWHMKVVRLSPTRTGRLYPLRKYSWYSFLLEAECNYIAAGGLVNGKIPMTTSGIEDATF
jgi:hypothetical protein